MSLIAGVDIGNCTTEIIIARRDADGPVPVWHGQAPTSGRKGSQAALLGAANLLRRGESEARDRVELVALAHLRPVDTVSIPLATISEAARPVRNLCHGATESPAGTGTAVGIHVPLTELTTDPSGDDVVVSVPEKIDFDDAARQLTEAWNRGWNIVGVLVAEDNAVLIHNRIPFDVPIVDEADVTDLRHGDLVALEIVAPGVLRRTFADPLALADALRLEVSNHSALASLTRELADASALALTPNRAGTFQSSVADADRVECLIDGVCRDLGIAEAALVLASSPPGSVRRVHISTLPGGGVMDTTDAFVVDLATVDDGAWLRRRTVNLDRVLVALLSRDAAVDAASQLSAIMDRTVVTVTDESTAAALGASSTPAFPPGAAVCDIGAGTVDCIWEGHAITGAGGGQIVTLAVGAALEVSASLAEQVKRTASIRVEGPYLAHEEDGRRTFLPRAAPSAAIGRLCVRCDDTLLHFSDRLAPEEWRSLRLAIKQASVAANVTRCLEALPGRPSAVVIAGGGALDDELVRSVSERLHKQGVVVGRANVAGRHGPRFAVAWGLVRFVAGPSWTGG